MVTPCTGPFGQPLFGCVFSFEETLLTLVYRKVKRTTFSGPPILIHTQRRKTLCDFPARYLSTVFACLFVLFLHCRLQGCLVIQYIRTHRFIHIFVAGATTTTLQCAIKLDGQVCANAPRAWFVAPLIEIPELTDMPGVLSECQVAQPARTLA